MDARVNTADDPLRLTKYSVNWSVTSEFSGLHAGLCHAFLVNKLFSLPNYRIGRNVA